MNCFEKSCNMTSMKETLKLEFDFKWKTIQMQEEQLENIIMNMMHDA